MTRSQRKSARTGRRLRAEIRIPTAIRWASRSADRSCRTGSFTSCPATTRTATRRSSSIRTESRRGSWTPSRSLGSPDENGPIARTDDALALLAKLDWRAGDSHLLTLRYAYTWSDQKNGTFDVNSWGRSANADEKDFSKAITGSALSTFNANLSNEFRFQFAREDRPRAYDGPTSPLTGRPLPDTAFDFVNSYRFGEPFFIPVDYHDDRSQFVDNVSYFWGQHTFKGGVEYNRTAASQIFRGFINGRYIFGSTDDFLDYLHAPPGTGRRALYIQQAGVGNTTAEEAGTQTIVQKEWGVFGQDTWQPMPNLTINLGLRWEEQIEPPLITPIPDLFYAPFIGQTRDGQEFPGNGTIPSDKNMWQPRIGIAWDPANDGKSVVRATFGIFYARIPGLNLASSRSTDGSRGQEIDCPGPELPERRPPLSRAAHQLPGGAQSSGRLRLRQELPESAHHGLERLGRARGHSESLAAPPVRHGRQPST